MKDLASVNRWLTLSANVGVLIGLIFLAVEVRYAGNATELQTIESTTEGWFRLNELIISDAKMARIWVLGLEYPEALTDVESIQFSMFIRMFANQVERVGNHYELGLASEEDYQSSLAQLATFINKPGGKLFRKTSPGFDEEFSELLAPYVNSAPAVELMLGRDVNNLK